MSRKSLIICLAALAAMLLVITIGVAVLYSGTDTKRVEYKVADNSQFLLLPAVPTDALAVCCFSEPSSVLSGVVSSNGFAKSLLSSGVSLDNMVVSLHFAGKVCPLYLFDAGDPDDAVKFESAVKSLAKSAGLHAESFDCSELDTDRKIADHMVVLVSPSRDVVKSSVRHLKAGESVIGINDFAMASSAVSGKNILFVSNRNSHNLLPAFLTGKFARHSDFIRRISDWLVLDITGADSDKTSFVGQLVSDSDTPDIMSVFSAT
mgnify:CR=1 FL=1